MASVNDIQKELQQISPLVASLPAMHPYQAPPPGYFDLLPVQIMDQINTLETEILPATLVKAGKRTPFEVPAGYFNNLPEAILRQVQLMEVGSPAEELEALSPLLSKLDKKPLFTTPAGYFEELTQDVIAGVNAIDFVRHELAAISPLMSAAQNKNVYQVPQDYFNKLPGEILSKVKGAGRARIISLPPRRKLMQYAVAAMLAGVIAVGTWLSYENRPSPAPGTELGGIEKISDDEIVNYLDNNSIDIPENSYTVSSDLKEEDVKELLTDISDQELQQYLEQYSVSKDLLTN